MISFLGSCFLCGPLFHAQRAYQVARFTVPSDPNTFNFVLEGTKKQPIYSKVKDLIEHHKRSY